MGQQVTTISIKELGRLPTQLQREVVELFQLVDSRQNSVPSLLFTVGARVCDGLCVRTRSGTRRACAAATVAYPANELLTTSVVVELLEYRRPLVQHLGDLVVHLLLGGAWLGI